ncbi:hypothetical protein KC19_1G199200 [Ceratodon purpureus]|uniref:Fungal lipase-type domain-containing protein n=1 Tax=Ceratodon purpureus TaxID=3225 RepID=A0A8T0J9D4_CERPU|nr:hypothetical protein KC19_1G199200 [Ceratodon purpureus]
MAYVAATGVLCAQTPATSNMHGGFHVATPAPRAMMSDRVIRLSSQELAGKTFRIDTKAARIAAEGKVVCQSLGERTKKSDAAPSDEISDEISDDFAQKRSVINFSNEAANDLPKEVVREYSYSHVIPQEMKISSTLASRWREIQGANNWEGLVDPLDMDLRMELIRYGEFAQACYDAFDNQPHSKYMGSNLFSIDTMFEKVGLPDTGYEITDYLFATTSVDSFILRNQAPDAWSRNSNWIGYIAVCVDEEKIKRMGRRDILLAWRGTATKLEWAANLAKTLVPCSLDPRATDDVPWNMKVMMEEGFLNLYTTANSQTRYNRDSARVQILKELKRLIKKYDDEELSITITGHSLGAAMAVLSGYDIAMSGINRHGVDVKVKDFRAPTEPTPTSDPGKTNKEGARGSIPVTCFTFAGPRVGNTPFREKVRDLGVKILRVTNEHDMVPKVPSPILNEDVKMISHILERFPWTYSHVGAEIELNHDLSPDLHKRGNPVNAHNMEAYLHLLTGYHGPGRPWKVVVERDLALINKASDFVCPKKTGIPTHWWQPENKGLVRNSEGKWVQIERDYEDLPESVLKSREEKKKQMEKQELEKKERKRRELEELEREMEMALLQRQSNVQGSTQSNGKAKVKVNAKGKGNVNGNGNGRSYSNGNGN